MRFRWLLIFFVVTRIISAQMQDDDVDGLEIQDLSKSHVRLTWKAEVDVPCVYRVTYSVFRSPEDGFKPSSANRVMTGIKSNSVTLLDTSADSYYHVRAVHIPVSCVSKPEPGFRGFLRIHPFSSDTGELMLSLRTKWQSEDKQKGLISYIVSGFHLGPGDDEAFYTRARLCSFTLELQDSQGFKVKDVDVTFIAMSSATGTVTGLEANDLARLSNEQYRQFSQGGNWSMAWTCPK